MESTDADRQVETPVTAPDGSRRNRQEHGDGASMPTAITDNSCPQTMKMMEVVVERENIWSCVTAKSIAAFTMYYMNRRGTEPYARWCGRTAGVIPPPTRLYDTKYA